MPNSLPSTRNFTSTQQSCPGLSFLWMEVNFLWMEVPGSTLFKHGGFISIKISLTLYFPEFLQSLPSKVKSFPQFIYIIYIYKLAMEAMESTVV